MSRIEEGYELIFYRAITRVKTIHITEAQIDRQYLHKVAVNVGIEFYALTGPYDCADEYYVSGIKTSKRKGGKNAYLDDKSLNYRQIWQVIY